MNEGAVRCTFEISFEDFREAVLAIQQLNVRRQQARNARKPGGALVAVSIGAAMVVVVLVIGFGFRLEQFAHVRPPHYVLFTLLIPGVAVTTVVLAMAHRQRIKLIESPRPLLKRMIHTVVR